MTEPLSPDALLLQHGEGLNMSGSGTRSETASTVDGEQHRRNLSLHRIPSVLSPSFEVQNEIDETLARRYTNMRAQMNNNNNNNNVNKNTTPNVESTPTSPVKPTNNNNNNNNVAMATTKLSIKCKIVICGEISVGKTAITQRIKENKYNVDTKSTIGVAFSQVLVRTPEGHHVNFEIWDSAGDERFHSINSLYFRGALAAFIVFDVTKRQSFENLNFWLNHVKEYGSDYIKIAIVANKIDLDNVVVTRAESMKYASSVDLPLFECSAKTGKGVQELFRDTASELIKLALSIPNRRNSALSSNNNNGLINAIKITQIDNTKPQIYSNDENADGCCSQ